MCVDSLVIDLCVVLAGRDIGQGMFDVVESTADLIHVLVKTVEVSFRSGTKMVMIISHWCNIRGCTSVIGGADRVRMIKIFLFLNGFGKRFESVGSRMLMSLLFGVASVHGEWCMRGSVMAITC